jgi:hypothetical protein
MQSPACATNNDADAVFCSECGRPLGAGPKASRAKSRKAYLFALVLVPMLAIVAGLGYYKFFLPDGIAAVVNGEEIKTAELDAAVPRVEGVEEAAYRGFRSQALNELITERLALQEARAAGTRVSAEEISSAMAEMQASSGLDKTAFQRHVESQFGGMRDFEKALERRLIITKFLTDKIIPRGADPRTAGKAVNAWIRNLSNKAVVRVSLAEQSSGPGCGCCSKGGGPAAMKPGSPKCGAGAPRQGRLSPEQTRAAHDASLAYWREKHGPDAVATKLTDFGCHIQVDIVRNEKIVGSLVYQAGNVTEM